MAWVKRNLGLVIGGVVALLLMGLAGFYLFKNIQEERQVTTELDETNVKYTDLLARPVHPGNEKIDNVANAKKELVRLQSFLQQAKQQIVSPELPKDLSNRDFRALLDNTITELQREAERNGVTLPGGSSNYWFTFQGQKTAVEFSNLQGLAHALMDIKALTEVLYDAKVHDILAIRRTPASKEESGADFLGDKKASTNQYAIVHPYEITFQGFSSEVAKVLDGMIKSKRCFVVRSVGVDKATNPASVTPTMPMMNNPYAGRYGMRAPQPVAPVAPPVASRGPAVILDEGKLRVTLSVDAVRLKPAPEAPKVRTAAVPPPAEG